MTVSISEPRDVTWSYGIRQEVVDLL